MAWGWWWFCDLPLQPHIPPVQIFPQLVWLFTDSELTGTADEHRCTGCQWHEESTGMRNRRKAATADRNQVSMPAVISPSILSKSIITLPQRPTAGCTGHKNKGKDDHLRNCHRQNDLVCNCSLSFWVSYHHSIKKECNYAHVLCCVQTKCDCGSFGTAGQGHPVFTSLISSGLLPSHVSITCITVSLTETKHGSGLTKLLIISAFTFSTGMILVLSGSTNSLNC